MEWIDKLERNYASISAMLDKLVMNLENTASLLDYVSDLYVIKFTNSKIDKLLRIAERLKK